MSSGGRLRTRCHVTTALCCTLAPLLTVVASPAQAADECGPVPLGGGTIECPTANYPDGIAYDAGVEDLTVVVDPGSTLEGGLDLIGDTNLGALASGAVISTSSDDEDGVHLESLVGDLTVAVSDVTTYGMNSEGVLAVTQYGDILIHNGVKGQNGQITTYGIGSDGIHAEAGGDIEISSASIQTVGGSADGMEAHSVNGGVSIFSSSINTNGRAIVADGKYDINIESGSIHATASSPYNAVDAIHAVSGAGSIGITSGDLETSFDRGIYGRANYGSIGVYAGSIHTTGAGGQGVVLLAGGNVNVAVDDLTTHSDAFLGDGIIAYSGGAITIATGDVDVYGGHSSAILGYGDHGVQISAGDVTLGYNSIWGPVGAGEAITGLAPYGDVTISAHNVYSQGRGIAGEAFYGNIAITANDIVAGADAPYSGGLIASTFFGDVDVDVNSVTTHDQYAIAAFVRAEGDLDLSFGSVDTTGYLASGVVVFGGGYDSSVVVTGDSIETDGDSSIGLFGFMFGTGSSVSVDTIGTTGLYSAGATITTDFSFNYYSGEIYYGTLQFRANTITTLGDYSDGLNLTSHAGDVYARVGEISTSGERSAGLVLIDTGAHLAPPNYGSGTFFFRPGDFDIKMDSVETSGDYSTAIAGYLQAGELHLDVDSIVTHGDFASGILLESGFVLFGAPGYELFDISVDHIETDGAASNGIVIYGNGGAVNLNVGDVVTHGADSSGLVALGLSDITIDAGTVDLSVADPSDATSYSTGIYAVSFGGNVVVDASSVSTGGNNSEGIIAASNGRVGYYGDLYVGDVAVAADQVSTAGANAPGMAATSIGGNVTIDVGSVETHGDYSTGVAANALAFVAGYGASNHTLYGGDLTVVANDVTTTGDHSDGISALSFSGGDTNVTVGTVETSGDDSYGVNVVTGGQVNYYTGQFYGGSTTVTVDKVTTSGAGSNGVRVFAFTGDVDLTVGSVDVSGENSDAVIGVNGSNGSVVVNVLDHAMSQQGFGIVASAYDDVDVNIAAGARVFGGSVGVYGSANADGATTHITNFGEIATSGGGIAILATGQGITIDNSGAVIGPVSLTDHGDVFNNVGTWQSFGPNHFGLGDDIVLNTGRLIIGAGQAGELTKWSGLETLDNHGVVDMADGHADQMFDLNGTAFAGGAGSRLALDVGATASGLTADQVQLGAASGSTQLVLSGTGGIGRALAVDATASTGASNFFLAGGAADLGLIRITLDYDAARSNWSLVGSPDQEVFEGVRFGAQAQSLWRRAVDAWSQTMNEGPAPERFTIWGRYLTGHEDQDLSPTFTALGVDLTPSLNTDAKWDGAVLGASFGRGGWTWGALAGFTHQTTRFTFDDNKLRAKGANFGAYADWHSDKVFARAIADYQNVQAKADLRSAAISDTVHGSTFGVKGEAGLDLAAGALRIRPQVAISWTRGHLDDLNAPGASLDFHGFTSLEGSAGATFSGIIRAGATAVHPYAGLYAVHEFNADNALDFTVGSQSLRLVDQPRTGYAKATAGFVADLGGAARLSVGGEVDVFGGRNAVKGLVGLSWHG